MRGRAVVALGFALGVVGFFTRSAAYPRTSARLGLGGAVFLFLVWRFGGLGWWAFGFFIGRVGVVRAAMIWPFSCGSSR